MNFSEKQLVDLFMKGSHAATFHTLGYNYRESRGRHWRPDKFLVTREYALPSGKRCDLVVHDKRSRYMWICEFKVIVEPSAITQLYDYAQEAAYDASPSSDFGAVGLCLAGQFFKPETIFFARHMNIQCLHVAPVNYERCRVEELNSTSGRKFGWGRIYG